MLQHEIAIEFTNVSCFVTETLKQTNKQKQHTKYEIRNNKSRKYGLLFLLAGYITLSHIFTCSLATNPKKLHKTLENIAEKTITEKTINIKKKKSKLNTFDADSWPEICS